MTDTAPLPGHLAGIADWVEIPGLGWLAEWRHEQWHDMPGPIDFLWWHDCPTLREQPGYWSPIPIDVSSGQRHATVAGSLTGGDLTIHGGTGSIPCPNGCGIHGWVRDGSWVRA